MHPAALPIEQLLKDVEYRTSRGSGPGGQHRNKTETMANFTHRPTGIHAKAGERRSLDVNRVEGIPRLRLNLALRHREPLPGLAPPTASPAASDQATGAARGAAPSGAPATGGPPPLYEPSALWRSRLRGTSLPVSVDHDDFPGLLAEALDVLAHHADDVPAAARTLGLTTSQFVKFLAREPAALAELNGRRTAHGKPPLR